jgi:hypothetical protein
MAPQKRAAALLLTLGLATAATLSAGISGSGCVIDWADDCTHDRYAPGCKGGTLEITTGSGANGTGGRGTGSTDGGDGGPMGCKDPSTCPAVPAGPCASLGTVTCTGGVCGVTYTAGPAPSQVYGNCHQNVCDANGVESSMVDTTNIYTNGNACTPFSCSPVGLVVPGGVPAMTCGQSGFCEPDPESGVLICAECNPKDSTACVDVPMVPGTGCSLSGTCIPTYCFNGMAIQHGGTDTNCGGTSGCLPCANGKNCNMGGIGGDCLSLVCSSGTCQAPTCSDNWKNGTETGIDCGGMECKPCPTSANCLLPTDCVSGVCRSVPPGMPATCQAPTCTDGVQNGGETGVDCGGDGDGGPICPPCADGGQ